MCHLLWFSMKDSIADSDLINYNGLPSKVEEHRLDRGSLGGCISTDKTFGTEDLMTDFYTDHAWVARFNWLVRLQVFEGDITFDTCSVLCTPVVGYTFMNLTIDGLASYVLSHTASPSPTLSLPY